MSYEKDLQVIKDKATELFWVINDIMENYQPRAREWYLLHQAFQVAGVAMAIPDDELRRLKEE